MTESNQTPGEALHAEMGGGSPATAAPAAPEESIGTRIKLRLMNFPISFFAMILGLTGFTIAFQRAEMILKPPFLANLGISNYILGFTVVLFVLILLTYLIKLAVFPGEVIKEINHPVRLSFFPTISISLLLFSIATFGIDHITSLTLWVAGTVLHALLTLYIISVWIQHPKFQITHFNAAWFIPVVGNIIVPVAGSEHGFMQISWFFFSVGFVFWIVLMTLLFNRLIFHHPLPERLIPTLFIMIAPPAVGFISYGKLTHEHLDHFALVLYYVALFLFALLVFQIKMFSRIQFYLSWWAYSFPIAAMTIASMFMMKLMRGACAEAAGECAYTSVHTTFYLGLSYTLFGIITLVIIVLLFRTLRGVTKGEICVEEG
jgi:tellurite resistance protein